MWKHKNFINLQLHAPPPISLGVMIYVNGEYMNLPAGGIDYTWKENYEYFGSWAATDLPYTLTDTNVVWEDSTILQYNGVDVLPTDAIITEGQYTTRSAGGGGATMNFKHFYDSGTIGSGTIKFRHYSQTEPLPQLATPQNVAINGTTLSWDAVENATSYDIYADGTLIGNTTGGATAYTISNISSFNTGLSAGSDLRAKFDEPPTSETDFTIRFADKRTDRGVAVKPATPLTAKKIYVWGYGGGGVPTSTINGLFVLDTDNSDLRQVIANDRSEAQRVAYNNAEIYEFTQNEYLILFRQDAYDY